MMASEHNCQHLLDSLSEYVDGTLDQSSCNEIERHLGDCEDCQVVVNTLEKTVYLYHKTAEPQDVPQEVKQRLYKKLDLEGFLESS
jgi:anti-sigma factor (TIGR02949 family)